MPTINQLPVLSTISSGDQLPVYSPNNGDARRTSIGSLLTFFQQSFASPTVSTNLYTPGAGFNITVPTPVAEQQWMLIQPAGTLATGTVTLPLNTGVPDGTEVLISTTQTITAFTIALNGAAAIYGGVTSLSAGSAVRYRYYLATNSWYNITSEAFSSAIQDFLNNPTSANLRAAMTDETGTGLLVFNTSPTMVTPVLGAATATSLAVSGLATVGTTFNVTGATTLASTLAVAGVSTLTAGAVIQGMTVGRGLAAIATNTAAGASALSAITTGSQNTAVGANAAKFIQAADNCVAVGNSALINATAGNGNTSIGSNTLTAATPGALNTALGNSALQSATGGSNTAIGNSTLMSAGGACVALGNTAGQYETGANAFYVNNQDRTNNAGDRSLSLMFGTFNTIAATQSLAINGTLAVSEITGTRAAATTIASAATIAPTKDITFISGTAAVVTITPIAPFTTGGGTITLIPTGAFTWTTAGGVGGFAVAGTAVVNRALTMTYDSTTTKWYPSYV